MKKTAHQIAVLLVVLSLIVGLLPSYAAAAGPQENYDPIKTANPSGGVYPGKPLAYTLARPLGFFSLTKTADSPGGVLYPGTTITYTVVVSNGGTTTKGFLADPIPTNTTYVAGSVTTEPTGVPDAYYETAGNRIVWTMNEVTNTTPVTITFQALVGSGIAAGTRITNTATLYDDNPDSGGQQLASASVGNEVLNPLTVSKTAVTVEDPTAGTTVAPWGTITYTISLANNGPVALTAGVTDAAPTGTKFVTATATTPPPPTKVGEGFTWAGSITSGGVVTITYVITTGSVITTDATIVNQASVTNSQTTDIKIAGPVTTTVIGKVAAVKLVDPSSAYPGDRLSYTIIITNNNSVPRAVQVTDPLPSDLNKPPTDLVGGIWDGNNVVFASSLAPGEVHTIRFSATIKSSGLSGASAVTNTAQINDGIATFQKWATTILKSLLDASTKTDAPDPVSAGGLITYTITLSNSSTTTDAVGASVSDPTPTNTTFVTATASFGSLTAGAGGISWSGTVSKATSVVITYTVQVNSPLDNGTVVTNTATIADGTGLPSFTRIATTTVSSAPNLSTSYKSVNNPTPEPGTTVTYTIVLTNTGNMVAYNRVLTDPVPSPYVTFGTPVASSGLVTGGAIITWTGSVTPGTPVLITIPAVISSAVPLTCGNNNQMVVTNTATVDSLQLPKVITVTGVPALTQSKSVVPTGNVLAGGWLIYTVVIVGGGTGTACSADLFDAIPSSTSFVSSTLTCSSGTQCFWSGADNAIHWVGDVTPSQQVTVTFSVAVTNTAFDGTVITNVAKVAPYPGGTQVDTNVVTNTVYGVPDLSTSSKTVSKNNPVPGETITYTIIIANTGNAHATNTTLSDSLPANTSYVSHQLFGGGTDNSSGGNLSWTVTVTAGQSVTATYTVKVNSPLEDGTVITNTAIISQSRLSVPVTKTAVVTVTGAPNVLGSYKSAPSSIYAGQRFTYTIVLINSGSGDATGTSLYDPIPANTTYADALSTQKAAGLPDAYYLSGSVNWVGTLSASQRVTITFAVTANSNLISGTTILNNATLYTQNQVTPTKQLTATSTVRSPLQVSKTVTTGLVSGDGRSYVFPGGRITYTIRITNVDGIDPVTNVSLVDPTPANTTFAGATVNYGTLFSGTGGILWTGAISKSTPLSVTFVVTANTGLADGTVITNTLVVSDGLGYAFVLTNTTTVVRSLLEASKVVVSANPYPAGLIQYQVRVTNATSALTVTAIVTDPIPANTSFDAHAGDGNYVAAQNAVVMEKSLGPGAAGVFTLTVQVNGTVTRSVITNTAFVNDGVNPVFTRVVTTELKSLLDASSKVVTGTTVPGQRLTYTVYLTNSGPIAAIGAVMLDPIPANTTYAGYVTSTAGTASYNSTFNWIAWTGNVPAGGQVAVSFAVTVTKPLTNGTVITNTAYIADGAGLSKVITRTDTVSASSNLVITKTASSLTPEPGKPITYTIVVANEGTENAPSVTVIDPWPLGVSHTGHSQTSGSSVFANNILTWTGAVNVDSPVSIYLYGTLTATSGTVTNTATISGGASSTVVVTPTGVADFSTSTKAADPAGPVVAGQTYTFTILVKNTGTATSTFNLADPIPANTTYVAGSASGASYNTAANRIECNNCGPVAVGGVYTITFKVTANDNNTITNTATLEWDSRSVELQAVIPAVGGIVGQVALQGISGSLAGYTVTVKLSGTDLGTYTLDASGKFTLTNIPVGTYNVWVKHLNHLANAESAVVTGGVNTPVNFGTLLGGDAVDDNVVDEFDLSAMAAAFGKLTGQPGYNDLADFVFDGSVDEFDFSLLANNYGMLGDTP